MMTLQLFALFFVLVFTHLDVSSLSQQIHELRKQVNIINSANASESKADSLASESSMVKLVTDSVQSLSDDLRDLKSQIQSSA